MRRAHKLLPLLLALTLALGLCVPAGAADYSDTNGHWAESAIGRWSSYGVLNGKGGGSFDPDGSMTRAEFAQMLCNMMGYTEKAANTFADVPDDAWYADAMLRLAAAGVISGVGGNMAAPDAPITREQAAVMLCRAFSIKTGGSAAMGFADADSVASWARDSVAALAGMGMIGGVGGNKVAPKLNINRASVAKLVDNMVAEYVTGDKTITGEVKGVVIVAGGASVTFDSASVSAPILVAPGAGGAKVELAGTTSAENVVVAADKAAVTVGKDASAGSVAVEGEGAKVDVSGSVGAVSAGGANTAVAVSGTVGSIAVAAGADKTGISAGSGAKIGSVTTAAEGVKVSGTGSVGSVTAEGGSADVSTKGTEVKNEGSGNVTAGGKPVASGGSATSAGTSTSGGSTGGGSGSTGGGSGSTGGSTPSHTHSWGEGVVTTPATCTAAGVKTFTCSCGETKAEAIEAPGHTEAVDEAVAATCTAPGKAEGKHCSVCGAVIEAQETVEALGHDWGYKKDETGHWHKCTRCDVTEKKAVHTYPEGTTCTDAEVKCTVCEYEKTGTDHVGLGEGVVTQAATCTADGVMSYTCSACTATVTGAIPALGHDMTAWDSDIGCHWSKCSRCDYKDDDSTAPHSFFETGFSCTEDATCTVCGYVHAAAGEHKDIITDEAIAATCTTPGKTEGKICNFCRTVIIERTEVPALGHTEVIDAAVAATCTEAGKTEGKHCSVCETVITAQTEVPAKGHAYGEWTKVDDENHKRVCANDAGHVETETHTWNDGVVSGEVKTFTCTVCGATKTESIPMETPGNPWIEPYQSSGKSSFRVNFTSDELLKLLPEDNQKLSALVGKYTIAFGDKEVCTFSVPADSPVKNDTFSLYVSFSSYTLSNIGPQQNGLTLTLQPVEGSALTAPVTLTNEDFSYTYSKLKTPASQEFTMQYVEEDSKIYFSGLDLAAYDYAVDLISNEAFYSRRNNPLNWDYTKKCYYYGGAYEQWEKTLGNRISLRRFDVTVSPNSVSLTQTAAVLPWFTGQYLGGEEHRKEEIAGTTTLSFAPGEASSIYTPVGNGIFTLATTSEGTFTQYGHISSNASNSGSSYGMQNDGKSAQLRASSFLFSSMGEFGAFDDDEVRYEWFYFKDAEGSVSAVSPVLIVSAEKADAVTAVDGKFSFEGDENGFYYITNEPGQGHGSVSGSTTRTSGTTVTGTIEYLDSNVTAPAVWYWDGKLTTDSDGNYRMNFIYYPIVEK